MDAVIYANTSLTPDHLLKMTLTYKRKIAAEIPRASSCSMNPQWLQFGKSDEETAEDA